MAKSERSIVIFMLSLAYCAAQSGDCNCVADNKTAETNFVIEISNNRKRYPSTCAEAALAQNRSAIYTLQLSGGEPFLALCDQDTKDGGWLVIQKRIDDSIDFNRDWESYKIGFGNLASEFFIGLESLHKLTTLNDGLQELLIVMSDFDNVTKYAIYSSFAIGNEGELFSLKLLGNYSGDAGDSLTYHAGYKFATKDKDNTSNCAVSFKGAWWYKTCHQSNLNGLYLKGVFKEDKYAQGIVWNAWRGNYYSLKSVQMMIRPQKVSN